MTEPSLENQKETKASSYKTISLEENLGRVTLDDVMGSDLSVVNAARVSFGKRKEIFDSSDHKLIHYLAKHEHMSPFRHVCFRFVLEGIPEIVCRQLYKHQVGCAFTSDSFREAATVWNELSGRYVTFEPEFAKPEKFRRQHPQNKQASIKDVLIEEEKKAHEIFEKSFQQSYKAYQDLLNLGVCKEQARMVLPLSFRNSFVWTASLEAVSHFIKLRTHEGAQVEIRYLAEAIKKLIHPFVPISLEALLQKTDPAKKSP